MLVCTIIKVKFVYLFDVTPRRGEARPEGAIVLAHRRCRERSEGLPRAYSTRPNFENPKKFLRSTRKVHRKEIADKVYFLSSGHRNGLNFGVDPRGTEAVRFGTGILDPRLRSGETGRAAGRFWTYRVARRK